MSRAITFTIWSSVLATVLLLAGLFFASSTTHAAPNQHINYQGKLTDTTGVAVADGTYNMWFFLYNTTGGATTTNIWEEQLIGGDQVQVTNGLFSVMLGSTSPLTSVDFNQTLYLGVEIGGSGAEAWDGEMSPRKILGTVPAAFEAIQLDGIASSSFLRSDQADTLEATESGTLLTLIQNGAGAILSAINSSAENVFSIFESGIVTVGTSTDANISTSTGLAVYNKDVEILPGDPVKVGGVGAAATAYAVKVVGDYAYVGSAGGGDDLEIFDVSDPTSPVKLGGIEGSINVYGLDVAGNYVYTVSDALGEELEIYDVSDATNPVKIGGADLQSSSYGVAVSGNYLYAIVESSGTEDLTILDVSDPVNPFKVGTVNTAGGTASPNDIYVVGSYVYIVSDSTTDDLEIFNVEDPTSPVKVGGMSLGDIGRGVVVSGKYAYVVSDSTNDDLEIIDISDPANPTKVGGTDTAGNAIEITLAGNYAYVVGAGSDEIEVFDISSSTNPVKVGAADASATANDITISGNYLYVASTVTGDDLEIFDLGGLITPTAEIGSLLSNNIQSDYLRVTQALTTDGGLNVGTNALIGGSLTITGTASSSLQSANTNPALTITSGYVGIGTTTPYADLSLDGDFAITGGIYDNAASLGTNGQILQSDATGVNWVATTSLGIVSSQFTDGGDITYLTSLTDVLAIGTSTDIATSTGLAVYNRDVEILAGDPVFVASTTLTNTASDMVVDGGYAYMSLNSGSNQVAIFDISDPSNPQEISLFNAALGQAWLSIAKAGNYIFGGNNVGDITVVDVSNPLNPLEIDVLDFGVSEDPTELIVAGNYLYSMHEGAGNVKIIDISNPEAITEVSDVFTGNAARGALQGNYLYVTDRDAGGDELYTIDVSDPSNPSTVATIDNGEDRNAIAVSGGRLYVSTEATPAVLEVYDITDRDALTLLGTTSINSTGEDMIVSGNYLYVGNADTTGDNLQVYDISSSTNPFEVGSVRVAPEQATDLDAIAIHGGYLFAADDTFEVYRIGGLITPTAEIGTLLSNNIQSDYLRITQSLVTDGSLNVGTNSLIGGSLTITGTASSSLQVTNTNPALTITSGYVGIGTTTPYADLSLNGDFAITGGIYDNNASLGTNGQVLLSTGTGVTWTSTTTVTSKFTDGGDITYLTSLTDVLAIGTSTDIATSTGLAVYNRDIEILPGDPVKVGGIDVGDDANDIKIVGDYAYVVSDTTGDEFEIFDISDPTNPVLLGGAAAGDQANEVAVRGNYAYVVSQVANDDLEIFDISDPTNPTKVGGAGAGDDAVGVRVLGDYAYVASEFSGDDVEIFDISDPTNPTVIGSYNNGSIILSAMDVVGNYAYVVSNTGNDLQILDISDPTNPIEIGTLDSSSIYYNITVSGQYAYLSGLSGLTIIDISDPTAPTEVFDITEAANATKATVVGNYAYVSSNNGGDEFEIFDISSSTNPFKVGGAIPADAVNSLAVSGNYAYVVSNTTDDDLEIYDLSGLITPTAEIGNLLANDIQSDYVRVTQNLTADSLNINQNALIGGSLTITGTASSTLQAGNTNPALTITSGYVGIGTTTPYADLAINGDLAITGGIYDNTASLGTNGMILQTTGTGVNWIATTSIGIESSKFTDGGDITYLTSLTDVLAIGTSTDIATSTGLAVYNRDVEILAGEPTLVGNWDPNDTNIMNTNRMIDVVGDLAYVAGAASSNLAIVDISDPTNPTTIGNWDPNDTSVMEGARYVDVVGNYAYIAGVTSDNLVIVDVSDPTNPTTTANWKPGTGVLDGTQFVEVAGNYAYVTGLISNNFLIVDISDPTNPYRSGSWIAADSNVMLLPRHAAVAGDYAFVAGQVSDNLAIVDISDPANPTTTGNWDPNDTNVMNNPYYVEVAGNFAYVTGQDSDNVAIVDISDPYNPTTAGNWDPNDANTMGTSTVVQVVGDYMYVSGYESDNVAVVDISSSTNPVTVANWDPNDTNVMDGAIGLRVVGKYAYVSGEVSDNLAILDLAGLTTPTAEIGNLLANNIETDYLRTTQALVTDGSLNVGGNAMIGGSLTITGIASSSLQAANTNPALTITSGYVGIGTTTPYADLSVDGNIALTGGIYDANSTLGTNGQILQTDGTNATWVSTTTLGIESSKFTDGGDITYLTSLTDVLAIGTSTDVATSTGLAVYNRDIEILPGDPVKVGGIDLGATGNGIDIVGDYAYVVTAATGDDLEIFNISDPTNPTKLGGVDVGDDVSGVKVSGNYAYLPSGTTGDEFEIFDISDVTNPTKVGGTTGTYSYDVSLFGNYAVVTSNSSGDELDIFDISDPTDPFKVGSAAVDGNAYEVSVAGNYAYVISSTATDELEIFDLSDPANPTKVGGVDLGAGANGIAEVVTNYAYVVTAASKLEIIDVTDPTTPVEEGEVDIASSGNFVQVSGNYAYVGSVGDTFEIFDISSSTNPFIVGSLAVESTNQLVVSGNYAYLVGNGPDELEIFDLGGLYTPTAEIGNLLANDIETNFMRVTQALMSDSLNVNTNAMVGGALTITGTASSSLIASNGNTALTITSGFIEIGTSTNATSGIQIGYGAICVDNDGECSATTTGRISSVSTYSGNSDLAETYFSSDELEPGDIVQLEGELSVDRANKKDSRTIIGVVSTKPGVLLGFDDVSTREGENQYPIALKGRIPVKISTENGPVKAGDQLMLSSIPGTAMKATGTGAVVGIALENFNEERYYSETFINQYTDDLSSAEDREAIIEELESVPLDTATVAATSTDDDEDEAEVLVGQIVMFVDLSYRYLDDTSQHNLALLMGTTTEEYQGDDEDETLINRVLTLARSFVDGVLSVFELKAEKVEVAEELCINNTCIQAGELRTLIESLEEDPVVVDDTQDDDDQTEPPVDTTLPPTSTTTASSTASTTDQTTGNGNASSTQGVADTDTASTTPESEQENGGTSTSSEPIVEEEQEDESVEADPSTEEEPPTEAEETPPSEESEPEPEDPPVEEEPAPEPTPVPPPEPEPPAEEVSGDGGDT